MSIVIVNAYVVNTVATWMHLFNRIDTYIIFVVMCFKTILQMAFCFIVFHTTAAYIYIYIHIYIYIYVYICIYM